MRTEEETCEIRKLRMIIEVKHKETFRFEDRDEQKYRLLCLSVSFFVRIFREQELQKKEEAKEWQ